MGGEAVAIVYDMNVEPLRDERGKAARGHRDPSSQSGFFYGWVVVAAALLLNTTYGAFNAFGVFFTPLIREFGWSRTITSVAYSIYTMTYAGSVILMGRLSDRYGARRVVLLGSCMVGLGIILSSIVSEVWHLYLLFGVLAGAGAGTLFVPPVSNVTRWFAYRPSISLAVSISMTGVGAGTLALPPIVEYLIRVYGWRLSYVLVGTAFWTLMAFSALLLKDPSWGEARGSGGVPQWTARRAMKTRSFWSILTVWALGSANSVMLYVHLAPYAISIGIPPPEASITYGLFGLGMIAGRVVFGALALRTRARVILTACLSLQALLTLMLSLFQSLIALMILSSLIGLVFGGWLPQLPVLAQSLFGQRSIGSILGLLGTGFGLGGLIGPPLAGYVFDVTGNYLAAFHLAAASSIGAAALAFLTRVPRAES